MRKTEDIVALVFSAVLILIILGILVILAKEQKTSQQSPTSPTSLANPTAAPTPEPQNGRPPVTYDKKGMDKILAAIQNRKTLSHNDIVAKASILSLLPQGQQSGVIYYNSAISLEYIHSADLFQVEILTTDIKSAKDEANVWLRTHGLSQEAICTLPVEFYLNYDIANKLRQSNITFSPLANGCSQ